MAAFLEQGMSRLCLLRSFIIPAWGKRTGRANSYRAYMSTRPVRYECCHQRLGERVENSDLSKKYEDVCLNMVSHGKRRTVKEALLPVLIQMDGISQYYFSSEKKMLLGNATASKKSLHTCSSSEEKTPSNSRGSEDFGDKEDALLRAPSSNVRNNTIAAIKKIAIRSLAARPLTSSQLRKKLLGKNFPSDLVEAVITEFQASGMQSDYAYAETFSQSRWLSRGWGPKRIKAALAPKGISRAHIERALQHVFLDDEDDDEDDEMDKEKKWGMSKSAKAHLIAQATKQWLRGGNASLETRKVRMVRWLQYRGFDWDVIGSILRQLQSKYPAQ